MAFLSWKFTQTNRKKGILKSYLQIPSTCQILECLRDAQKVLLLHTSLYVFDAQVCLACCDFTIEGSKYE